jgi:hypothetical protein
MKPSRITTAVFVVIASALAAYGAENLRMRDGISFYHDLDQGFPILAEKMEDVQLAAGKPTLVFFGAAGDLNTNRQAKRIVDLYKKYKSEQLKFIVVDVDRASTPAAKSLIKAYYAGYIPAQVVFDKQGKQKWTHTGEVDAAAISGQVDKVLTPN